MITFIIAILVASLWTTAGYLIGMRDGWLVAMWLGTFLASGFSLAFMQSANSGKD